MTEMKYDEFEKELLSRLGPDDEVTAKEVMAMLGTTYVEAIGGLNLLVWVRKMERVAGRKGRRIIFRLKQEENEDGKV